MARRKSYYKKLKKASPQSIILAIIFLILAVAGYYVYNKYFKEEDDGLNLSGGIELASGEMSFHFMMLGNEKAGDCIYIKAGETDILIDGGSYYDSLEYITAYLNTTGYVTDGKIEYAIVTHADQDHIACFAGSENGESLFDKYEFGTIIDFPKTNKNSGVYNRYISERNTEVANGAKHYTALQCYNKSDGAQRVYDFGNGMQMEILYNYYYEHNSSKENNYSVCVMFYHGKKMFLFTGDLEKSGEEKLANNYDFTQVELYKAGHHGSETSSNDCLLKEIKPKVCVACCCAGSAEYSDNKEIMFPSQAFINRIAPYTKKVYVGTTIEIYQDGVNDDGSPNYKNKGEYTLLNGNIVAISRANQEGQTENSGVVEVKCSNNDTLLKDTVWFINNRTMPNEWKTAA